MVKQAWHLESCIWTTSVFEGLLRSLWLVHLFASLSTLQPRKADREKKERGKKKSSISAATFTWNEMARDHCFMAHPSVQMEGLLKASAWQPQLHVAGQPQRSRAAAMPQCGCPLRDPHTGTHDRTVPCTSRSLRGALQRCQQYWALANESKPILTEEWSKAGSTVLSLTVN